MHLESRCYSSSAINKQTDTTRGSIGQAAATTSATINRTWSRTQKKDKSSSGTRIFSFWQKFRVVNNKNEENLVANSRFSLGSPQSSRYSLASVGVGTGRRWESIESVISSATATSFAFIPSHQLRQFNYPRPPPKVHSALERDQCNIRVSNGVEEGYRLPRRRLASDEKRTTAAPIDNRDLAQVKRLNRNSTGNIEHLWISASNAGCIEGASTATNDKITLIIPHKRKRCYRPGKRKAPQPPGTSIHNTNYNVNNSRSIGAGNRAVTGIHYEEDNDEDEDYENDENRDINVIASKLTISNRKKKKRQAPLPPKIMNDERTNSDEAAKPQPQAEPTNRDLLERELNGDEPFTYCNDSLKLEKGILKANKHSIDVTVKSETTKTVPPIGVQTAAVSPKPWYKRSCVKVNAHNNLSSFREKRNSCRKDEMDQWMLESGIARFRRVDDDTFKRHSHISVLANISELDRQACEILEKQRKQQRDAINTAEAKFYSDLLENDQTASKNRFPLNETTPPNNKKNKDLISILNNLTSVTKMTVHSAFVSKTAAREGNDNEDNILVSGSSSSSVNKLAERSKQTAQPCNLMGNKNKKTTSKIGEIFDINHRNFRKKDDKKLSNKFSSSFDSPNETKTPKEKLNLGAPSTTFTPMKSNSEHHIANNDKNILDKLDTQQVSRPVQKPFSSWSCPQCYSENPSWKFICEKCKKWRPYSVSSRTTDQRYFVNLEKDNLKPKTNYAAEQQEQLIQIMHLNVQNSIVSEQRNILNNNLKSLQIKSNDSNKQRDTQRREFYSSIAAVTADKPAEVQKPSPSSISATSATNNLNDTPQTKSQSNKPLQYYNDEDRKMLRDILKELKHSLNSSKHGRMAIGAHEPTEQKIINEIDSVILKPSINSIGNNNIASTSTANDLTSTNSSTTITQNGKPTITAGIEKLKQTKYEANDEIDEKDTFQLPQNGQKQSNEMKQSTVENKNVPVLAINRLLKKLQTAIANGQHHEAANIARELARLKVSCHMTRRSTFNRASSLNSQTETVNLTSNISNDTFVISVYIKEQNHCRGPIPLQIHNATTLAQLKMKLSDEFKIPLQRQQWRSEKSILNDETAILRDLGIDKPGVPLYVHLTDNEGTAGAEKTNGEAGRSTFDENIIINNIASTSTTTQDEHYEEQAEHQASNWEPQIPNNKLDINELENDDTYDENGINSNNDVAKSKIILDDTQKFIPTIMNLDNESQTPPIQINKVDDNTTATVSLPNSGWRCTLCTLINEIHVKFCAACGEQYAQAKENNTSDINDLASTLQQNYNHVPWRTAKRDNSANLQNDNHAIESKAEKKHYYQELIDLEKTDLITNTERFECGVCFLECEENEGVVIRDCLHTFCKDCLQQTVQFSTEAQVKCPFRNASYSCDSVLQEREIKALVDAETYEKHLARSLSEAQNKIKNAFHCKTPNCTGWCIYEDNVNEFHCPVCRKTNCLTCQVIHGGLNCKQYQEMTKKESENNADTSKTRNMLEEMVEKGEAMVCPTCDIILMKKWGCDWLRCSMCKTEICWVTRGPRWGPAGKGDTSAGCRCGVNGAKCHPRCNYCH